jgi:hypothetical protein
VRIEEVSVRKRKNTPSERGGGRREEKGNEGENQAGEEKRKKGKRRKWRTIKKGLHGKQACLHPVVRLKSVRRGKLV